ncbi:MAG TPA: acyl-CoA dehydrogenase family protein [Rhizomicrobium sp.]|nr:acyl-CoA dehydrogenase family protein [Rhizomicrobium sp.]
MGRIAGRNAPPRRQGGFLRLALPEEFGGKNIGNLAMAIIREHLATKGLGLHNDLQNESSVVGNFPQILMFRDFGTDEQKKTLLLGMLAGQLQADFLLTIPMSALGRKADLDNDSVSGLPCRLR